MHIWERTTELGNAKISRVELLQVADSFWTAAEAEERFARRRGADNGITLSGPLPELL